MNSLLFTFEIFVASTSYGDIHNQWSNVRMDLRDIYNLPTRDWEERFSIADEIVEVLRDCLKLIEQL